MSEGILRALMQLFAIIADVDDVVNKSRGIVQIFLKSQLNQALVDQYLAVYDEYLEKHHKLSSKKEGKKKRTSLSSVKVLRICDQINKEISQGQKLIVLLRIIEYVNSDSALTDQELEFVTTIAESFNIPNNEFKAALAFVTEKADNLPDSESFLLINENQEGPAGKSQIKHMHGDGVTGNLCILRLDSVNMFILKYESTDEIYLNGQILDTSRSHILTQGSSIRSSKVKPIYYSDILSKFLQDEGQAKIVFTVDKIEYEFKGGKKGLHELEFQEESGKLLGVMGGSGAGKSTLLNVLNGNNRPSKGAVLVNGRSIHDPSPEMEGVVGYVSQDDLLIEELTVFQNLYYNAKLCFDGVSDDELETIVTDLLSSLGLSETRDLKVGSPLEKTISGGQRKRLNIGLELIREPSVLFVDEPTSGLSSRDSENIMDLLKELALKGKVVFVVIHQPSSEIFKMFDKLLILDVGGFPIYYGDPVDAVIYFKKAINHVKSDESECHTCGNVNPEQIFNIIESKVLDEYGNLTDNRKMAPAEWNELYREKLVEENPEGGTDKEEIPESTFSIPNKFKQFKVFLTRDVLAKLTNKQYLYINLLEAPILALILSYFVKFYDSDISNEYGYVFHDNENLPAYMFMAVVVSLFIGLTVSAEEIIRDQKIRKRESFLNLSNGSYLVSKIIIMFVLSAIQTITFLLVGNLVLGIHGMTFDYWVVLFTTACFANMLGLNISATFNSAVTIYILIPFLLIPQLLFSGVIVKFEKLNPSVTSQTHVPLIGDMMASRWAFEALAVNQFKNNAYEEMFYQDNKIMSNANFKKNFWIPTIKTKVGLIENNKGDAEKLEECKAAFQLIQNELRKESGEFEYFYSIADYSALKADDLSRLKRDLQKLNTYYIRQYNAASDAKDEKIRGLMSTEEDKEAFNLLKREQENEALADLVKNAAEFNLILEVEDKLIQRADPVYLDPMTFRAHFFAPTKVFMNRRFDTFWANMAVLWSMSGLLAITLYFDVFKKIMEGLGRLFGA